jgi:hypothetical protein
VQRERLTGPLSFWNGFSHLFIRMRLK